MDHQPTLSYLTLAGQRYTGEAHAMLPVYSALERAKAAHAVGLSSLGIRWDEPLKPQMLRYVTTPECEWIDLSTDIESSVPESLKVLAQHFGVTRLNVGYSGLSSPNRPKVASRLQHIAEACHPLGIQVNVEPVVFGGWFRNLSEVRDLLAYQDYPSNVGFLYDMFHVDFGEQAWDSYWDLPPVVTEIQISGTRQSYNLAQPWVESQHRASATDSFDAVSGMLEYLLWKFPATAVSYELPNEEWRQLPLLRMAEKVAQDIATLG